MEKDYFFEQLKAVHKITLTEQQYKGIINTEGKHLLLACPGSGKTTVMVIKTAYLIDVKGIIPSSILSLTFSKAAAIDMERRFCKLFGMRNNMPHFFTIHGFCNNLMKQYFALRGIKRENIEGMNSKNSLKNKAIAFIYEKIFCKKPQEGIIEEISSAISYIKNFMLSWEDLDEYQFNIRYLKQIFHEYEMFKDKNNYYDYDDMLLIGYDILLNDWNLLNTLRKQFLYIQIDEAQDNSKIQNELINLLVCEKSNLFMVADDDQTIYEFRGAYPEGVLKFREKYSNSSIHHMEQNFRSSKNIVEVSNLFIQNNQNRYSKNLTTQNPSNIPIQIIKLNSNEEQYDYAVKLINNKENLSKYAFLFRNNLSSVLLAYKLEEAGFPFFIKSFDESFFNHYIVNDMKAFMLFSITNKIEYFERIYYKNFAYISKKDFEQGKIKVTKKHSIIQAIYSFQADRFQKQKLHELKRQFKVLSNKRVQQALLFIRKELGYERWMKSRMGTEAVSTEGVNNIWRILEFIGKEAKDFNDFINRIDRLQNSLRIASSGNCSNAVALLTLHGSKGLEFDTVFMVDLDQGVIPSSVALDNVKQLEAERRLFYVGITRARLNLFLLTTSKEDRISLFVKEVERILQPEQLMWEDNN